MAVNLPSRPLIECNSNIQLKKMSKSGNRRTFVKTCLAAATMVATNPGLLARENSVKHYTRALLLDENDQPLTTQTIEPDQAYVFNYPYVTTPCFLINIGRVVDTVERLNTENQESYLWQGGAGAGRSVVAFSAICAHKLSYPTKTVSFLNYYPEKIQFVGDGQKPGERRQLIYCCSERSAYDPARGARVLGGPARQPLTAIEIEVDPEDDHYYAVGTRGGELYDQFFDRFAFRLALDHNIDNIRATVGSNTIVYPHSVYSKYAVSC